MVTAVPNGALRIIMAFFSVLMAGCAGWRGEGNTYYAHRVPAHRARTEATYRFGTPGESWRPVRKVDDVQVAWVRPDIVGLIELHAQCDEHGDSALDQYTDHLRIDWTDWDVVHQVEMQLIGRDALRTVVAASLDGIERRSEFVVVKKNGCLFDLRYSAAPDRFEAGQADFEAVLAGFVFPVGAHRRGGQ